MPASRRVRREAATHPADEALVAAAWAGDDDALGALLQRYRGFVRAKARPYFLAGGDRDDVVQEGMIGLYKAIRDFDVACNSTFRAFADVCVTRHIISAVKAARRLKHVPLNDAVSLHATRQDGDDDTQLGERCAGPQDDPAERVVSRMALTALERHCADVLSDLEAEVLHRYVAGESYAEIANVLDRHVKAIDNALQRVKRKLDAYLTSITLDAVG